MVIFYHPKINFLLTYQREKFTFSTKNNVKKWKIQGKRNNIQGERNTFAL